MSDLLRIEDVAKLNANSITKRDKYSEIKYLDTSNITRNVINQLQLLTEDFPSRARRKVKDKSIIYSTVRPNQEHYGIFEHREDIDDIIVSTGFVTIDVISQNIDSKYLYYKLTQPDVTRHLQTIAENSVSAYPSIKPESIGNLNFRFPKLRLQQKIASVLSTLDDKIELNNKINDNLEQQAKLLYDYWFVQFEFPNEDGKPYKSSGGKMVYNKQLKREIPEGWDVKTIDNSMRVVRGASPRPINDFIATSGMPWIKISDATSTNHRFILETKEYIKLAGVTKSRLLQPQTLILSNSASPGIPKIVQITSCVHDGWLIIDNFKYGLTNEFLFFYFENLREKILHLGSGSIFKNLKTEYIKGLLIEVPPIEILTEACSIFYNLSQQILLNAKQNQQLSSLRDWLLPMLMNGQVKVE